MRIAQSIVAAGAPDRSGASFFRSRSDVDFEPVSGTGGVSKRLFSLRTTSAVTRNLPLSLFGPLGELEHDVEHDVLDDRPQAAGSGILGLGHLGDFVAGHRG